MFIKYKRHKSGMKKRTKKAISVFEILLLVATSFYISFVMSEYVGVAEAQNNPTGVIPNEYFPQHKLAPPITPAPAAAPAAAPASIALTSGSKVAITQGAISNLAPGATASGIIQTSPTSAYILTNQGTFAATRATDAAVWTAGTQTALPANIANGISSAQGATYQS